MAVVYNPRIVTDGLILYLDAGNSKSYPGSGSIWNDLSGNNYNFTLTGSYLYENHRNSNCFKFDGGYNDVNCAYRVGSITQNIGQQCTINIVYCSIDNQNFNGCSRIFSCGENNGNNVDFSTYFTLASCDESKHGLWRGGGPQGFYVNSSIKSENDSWKLLTYSWASNSVAKGYVNGILETTTAAGPAFNTGGISRMAVSMNAALNIEHARARVALVQLYSTQLTDSQVQQNFNALRGRFGL